MTRRILPAAILLALASLGCESVIGYKPDMRMERSTPGPLVVSTENPRYFSANGEIVYLTGAHTWNNLQDSGTEYPPPAFDYPEFLTILERYNHNFFRLWAWEQGRGSADTKRDYWFEPLPFEVVTETEGERRYDLTSFNEAYFERLRDRVELARKHGFYVSVMLFNGWSIEDKDRGMGNPWIGHPFNGHNNVNGIQGDLNGDGEGEEVHTLANPRVTAIQEAYVRKVIDTVNEFDNVLYEISNESPANSEEWQYHMIRLVHDYETTKAKQHPVGMTVEWPDATNQNIYKSTADWVSPNWTDGGLDDPPIADGSKVILDDTDHLCGICGSTDWVWRSFTRGRNPLFMDFYDGGFTIDDVIPRQHVWEEIRENLGYARFYAERMRLEKTTPQPDLASTGFALADASPSGEYLVFVEDGGSVTVDLSATPGELTAEWFLPWFGRILPADDVHGGAVRGFRSPIPFLDAVLYLHAVGAT